MSIKIMSAVWDVDDLTATQKIILLSLADQSNDDGVCWPSASLTSKRTGMCERSTRSIIAELEKLGHLTRRIQTGKATIYRVHPCIKCTPASNAPLQLVPEPLQLDSLTPATDSNITQRNPKESLSTTSTDETPASNAPLQNLHHIKNEVVRFAMFHEWLPSDEFQERILSCGIREHWADHHEQFVLYWLSQPETKENEYGWENKFLKNIQFRIREREARLA